MIRAVGVIVPAHNEQELLPGCLASLRRAARALPGTPVYLVVVADECRDLTALAARQAGASVIALSAGNVGAARAAGAREALRLAGARDPASVWLATTDADTIVPAGWLRQQLRYASQGWDVVAGTVRVADWSGYRRETAAWFHQRYARGSGPHPHVHGANLGFRASAYLAAGGFQPVPTAEDHALVAALTAGGAQVLRTRALPVLTSARREGRAPYGFSHYLSRLDRSRPDTAPAQRPPGDHPARVA